MKGESKGVRVACLKKTKDNKIMQSSSVMPSFLEINVLTIKKKNKKYCKVHIIKWLLVV